MNEKKAAAIGSAGENQIATALKGVPGVYVLRNLYIPSYRSKSTEIDVLIATTKGLFVVEGKAWVGWIRGSARLNDWSVKIWVGSKPEKRYSPIKQNATHVRALSRYLNLPDSKKPHSIIVFTSNKAELKQIPKNTKDYTIIKGVHNLRTFIKRRLGTRHDVFTDDELRTIIAKLKKASNPTLKQKQTHIINAKKAERKRLQEKRRRRQKGSRRKTAGASSKRKASKRSFSLLSFVRLL